MIAKKLVPTDEVEISWDEGSTWERIKVSDEKLNIENIIIEPNSVSQQFMVYGSYAFDKLTNSTEIMAAKGERAFLTYIDLQQLHEAKCKGADRPGESGSDYELWSPNDGRHGDSKCFLGQTVTYVRRKQDSKCFNGEDHEPIIQRVPCACTDNDFECDMGYHRAEGAGASCQKVPTETTVEEQAKETQERQNEQCDEYGYYEVTQGYRKIPGNICSGGVDLSPYRYQCNLSGKLLSLRSLMMLIILAVVCYYGWPIIQTIIVLSPIPDPSDLKNRASGVFTKIKGKLTGNSEQRPNNEAYQSNFDKAPDVLGDGSDDDEEDIGRDFSQKKDLNYDSDEKEEFGNSEQMELVSLDTRKKNEPTKKNVPKLKKPGT